MQQPPPLKDLVLEYLGIVWRRKLCFLPFPLLVAAVFYYAMSLPSIYRSEGSLLVEDQNIPPELTTSTVTSYAAQQMEVIRQQLASTENVTRIIEEFDLYQGSPGADRVVLAQRFRNSMRTETINANIMDPQSGRRRIVSIAFKVSFTDQSPQKAQAVAKELVDLFLERNSSIRTEEAAQTSAFLRDEAEVLRERVTLLEDDLAEFKGENAESLPELLEYNLGIISGSEQSIRDNQLAIKNLSEQEQLLSIELRSMDPYTGLALGAVGAPAVTPGPQSTAALLSQKRAELGQLTTRYSESHPTVVGLRREIQKLEAQVASESSSGEISSEEKFSPAYLNLRYRVGSIERDIASLMEENENLKAQLIDYRQRVANTYIVEREYEDLQRDYQASSKRYEQLRNAQYEAEVTQSLEEKNQVESLKVIEEPQVPRSPIGPNRFRIIFLGFCFAGALPLGLIVFAEFMDERVRGRAGFERLFGEPALVMVPNISAKGAANSVGVLNKKVVYGSAVLVLILALAMLMYFFAS